MKDLPYCVTEARSAMIIAAQFFASLLYERSVIEVVGTGTDYPDGAWRGIPCDTAFTNGYNVVINVDWFGRLNLAQRVFVLSHEVMHVVFKHPTRFRYYMSNGLCGYEFSPKLANIAADAVINKALRTCRIGSQPEGVNLEPELAAMGYTLTGEEAWEDVYEVLLKNAQKNSGSGKGKGDGAGQGGDGHADGDPTAATGGGVGEGYTGDVGDPGTASGPIASDAEMRASIKAAMDATKSRGTMPGAFKSLLDKFLEPQVDWRDELATDIKARSEPEAYDWTRPNRRKIVAPGVYMPRRVGVSVGEVVVAIDTSGSVSEHELKVFMGELSAILSECRPERLIVIWCDAVVERVDEVETPEELLHLARTKGVPGRGGTSFIPPFEYVRDNDLDPAMIIYMTDGFAPFPGPEFDTHPTIWLMTGGVSAPFGKNIHVKGR